MEIPNIEDINAAAARIEPYVHRTPLLRSSYFNRLFNSEIYFKCENFQKVGAFKFRGACNALFSLTEEQVRRGVVTHSSGNHAQALALAARLRSTQATIVMPSTALSAKIAAVEEYGGEVVLCEPTQEARESAAEKILRQTGGVFIHPYDDVRIICGQGTAGLELFEQAGERLDIVLTPLGGGGLLSGTLLAFAALSPKTSVIGVEPAGADDARRSLETGHIEPSIHPKTICDGLLTSLSERTFSIIRQHVTQIVTVQDKSTMQAMRLVWERMKIVIEPSAAVPLAALLENKVDICGKKVGVIFSGGNWSFPIAPETNFP